MGSKKRQEEQNELIEFLYKDMDYIESFYSQIFQGNLSKVSKNSVSKESNNTQLKGSVGIAGGEIRSNSENEEQILEEINPHDSKILKLFEELDIKSCNKMQESILYGINIFNGTLEITDYDILKEQFDFMDTSGLLEMAFKFSDVKIPDAGGFDNSQLINLINMVVKFQPNGCDFILKLPNKEHMIVPLKKEYLTMKSTDIYRIYGSNIPGTWSVMGVLNTSTKTKSENELSDMLMGVQSEIKEIFKAKTPSHILKPIAIYRKLKN